VSIDELIEKSETAGTRFSRDDLLQVVKTSDKKRFFGLGRRAAHSCRARPFGFGRAWLVATRTAVGAISRDRNAFVESILSEGLKPQKRQQVHLSVDEATAERVGQRHGKPVIFTIDALRMHRQGFMF